MIRFDSVSKKYKLYSKGGLYLRDRLTHALQRFNPFNGVNGSTHPDSQSLERDFWALKNVSFEIKAGESVGFIGRNGAGKSTILKLLAGVTKPTSGKVEVNGRVAALIEVGAGFHPELTGRENIYLNGSILGMKKVEIEKQFDSIVSYAELEDFIDTPVKHYSSGMYVRLGFAIAAHTDPDIYLIDEVLAVGDEGFQKKCLDTLAEHQGAGKTMILVSHNLEKVAEVCGRCIYVNQGQIRNDGKPADAIETYRQDLSGRRKRAGDGLLEKAGILEVGLFDHNRNPKTKYHTGDDLVFEIHYKANQRVNNPVFGIEIFGPKGEHVAGFNTLTTSFSIDHIENVGFVGCIIRRLPLQSGRYTVNAALHSADYTELYDSQRRVCAFDVVCETKHAAGLVQLFSEWSHNGVPPR